MAADALSRFADLLPPTTPAELRGAFRTLASRGGSPDEVVERVRLASDLASPVTELGEIALVERWISAAPTHARYCFLADS